MAYKQINMNPSRFDKSQIKFIIVLGLLSIFMILPILYIIFNAFKPADELFAYPPKFFVIKPTVTNFTSLFRQSSQSGIPFTRYLLNSIVISVIGVVLTLLITTLAAFGLSKIPFKFKKQFFKINQVALMFVGTAVTIPRFLIVAKVGIYNSVFAHILPVLALPVGLFLVKQFVDQIPDELLEAAKIDGASYYQIFFKIIIPMTKPALATVTILAFQTFWNNEFTSQFYVDDESLKTVSYFLTTLTTGTGVAGQGISAAASLIMFVPNLIVFIIVQNQVMDTMAHSGIK